MGDEQFMIDFSAYIHSEWAWAVLFVMAVFVGMSKTGVQGLAILTVPMLAMTFGARPSMMGACLALVLAVMLWSQWRGKGKFADSPP